MAKTSDQQSYLTEADGLVFLIEEVPRKLRRVFDASTAKFGLTRTQWRALAYIFRTPGLTQTELAKCLELERASVGHVIDQLEKADYTSSAALSKAIAGCGPCICAQKPSASCPRSGRRPMWSTNGCSLAYRLTT
jgi:DNA-binding XRE family transcriptional regulator